MESLPDDIEDSPRPLLIDDCLDEYNAGHLTLEQAASLFQNLIKEAIE